MEAKTASLAIIFCVALAGGLVVEAITKIFSHI